MTVKEALEQGIMKLDDDISTIVNDNCYPANMKYNTWTFLDKKSVDLLYNEIFTMGEEVATAKIFKAFK